MKLMSAPAEAADLVDLKLLPAWMKETGAANRYGHYTAEERSSEQRHRGRHGKREHQKPRRQPPMDRVRARSKSDIRQRGKTRKRRGDENRRFDRDKTARSGDREAHPAPKLPDITIRFLPRPIVFENVVVQIKSAAVAYSLFALARLFLEKPGRYEVCVTPSTEAPLYQLGDGVVSLDQEFLDRNAFRFAQRDFYQIDVVESDPIKGNFSNVARCRLSGTLLGPTNHHAYQPQLRSLYEQRFSRRMSFPEYQRQIEIVSDPALVERWKEEARKVTTYTALRDESRVTFSSPAETERHFRSNYFPGLVRRLEQVTIDGPSSRRLPDRILHRAIEEAWVRENRSPSNIMQELAGRFRQNGLHIFRHRRGMLFVSPIRVRPFVHEHTGVSASVNAILDAVSTAAASNRRQLFETVIANGANEDAEARRLAVAAELRWLINEGYVIEFNDGSLDLPRMKNRTPDAAPAGQTPSTLSGSLTAGGMELVLATSRALAIYSPTILKPRADSPPS
jgi:hypothetical protein